MEFDMFVKSRHSGLSGIGCFCNVLKKKDSGQAGMTVSGHYRTFYESVKVYSDYSDTLMKKISVILLKVAVPVMAVLCLSLFSCAPKEVVKRAVPEPYQGPVTVNSLKQSAGFGNVRSIKALADVTIYKQGKDRGSMNGTFAYKAPGKMRIDLFGPFGLTLTEILISGDLLQLSVPKDNVLYEWNTPEVSFTGLMNSYFRYEMTEEDDMYVLIAYSADQQDPYVAAKYFFDRTYLLNRSSSFYKNKKELIKTEFNDFNNRVPERIKVTLSEQMLIDVALQEPELDTDITDEYFKPIEHGDRQIKSFEEVFRHFEPGH